jgi:hypothetical protein
MLESALSVQLPAGNSTHRRVAVGDCPGYLFDPSRVANDLVYATRLPFDPGSSVVDATSYVEGGWSRVLDGCHRK